MPSFITELIGQEKTDEGLVVTVRATGVGSEDGSLMARAKGRAIASSGFGPNTAKMEKRFNVQDKGFKAEVDEGFEKKEISGSGPQDVNEGAVFADKTEALFSGDIRGVRDRLKAFRKEGLFASVKNVKEMKTERLIEEDRLEEVFGPFQDVISTYQYEILVKTSFAL